MPSLAGVLARAYSYAQGWPAGVAAVRGLGWCWRALAAAGWFLLLVVARDVVRANGRCAVLTLNPGLGVREQLKASWRGLLTTLTAAALLEGAFLWGVFGLGVPLAVVDAGSGVLAAVVLPAFLVAFAPVLLRGGHGRQMAAACSYAQRQGERMILHAGMLATWPRGRGHMTMLLQRVQAEVDAEGACLIVYARSESLAAHYRRHGFRPVPGQGPQTLYRRASG